MNIDFYCLGAQKAGTTSLHHMLAAHPDVYLPAIKETHFFNDGHSEYAKGVPFYLARYFSDAPYSAVKGEIDPEYMFFPGVAQRIHAAFPKAKLIFILRDPVTRAYSHFLMSRRRGYERLSFAAAIEAEPHRLAGGGIQQQSDFSYVTRGFYYRQISAFAEFFQPDQILTLLSDDLKSNPAATLEAVHAFLGIRPLPYVPVADGDSNQAAEPRSQMLQDWVSGESFVRKIGGRLLPASVKARIWDWVERHNRRPIKPEPLAPELVSHLRSLFTEDVCQLEGMIGRDLSKWKAAI